MLTQVERDHLLGEREDQGHVSSSPTDAGTIKVVLIPLLAVLLSSVLANSELPRQNIVGDLPLYFGRFTELEVL
jgi:hypothetical protein